MLCRSGVQPGLATTLQGEVLWPGQVEHLNDTASHFITVTHGCLHSVIDHSGKRVLPKLFSRGKHRFS